MALNSKSLQTHELVLMPDFEATIKKLVSVPKEEADAKFAGFQASNKARSESRESKPD